MRSRAFVGSSDSRDSARAGRAAAAQAVAGLDGQAPSALLVFATAGHDQARLLEGVRAVSGQAPIAGCSAEGIITEAGSDEGTHAVAVMALASDTIRFRSLAARALTESSERCGREIARAIRGDDARQLLFLFPDGLTVRSAALLGGIESELDGPLPVVGGAAGETMRFERTFQYRDHEILSDAVSGLLVDGDFDFEIEVSHGCHVMGIERTITRSGDGYVHEIDGRPAWSVIKEYLEEGSEDLDALAVSYACTAERIDPGGCEPYGSYVIRVPLKLDKASGALYYPAELKTGAKLYMARRDPERIRESAIESAERIVARRPGQRPLAVVQLDCAGRGRMLFGERTTVDVIEPMQRVLGKQVPWIGFHTYGEIAPILGRTYFHQYTVALCALYGRDG